MRTPVNDPGPRPTATQAISPRPTPAWAHSSSIRGSSWVFDARRASTSTLTTHSIDCVAGIKLSQPNGNDLVGRVEGKYERTLCIQRENLPENDKSVRPIVPHCPRAAR